MFLLMCKPKFGEPAFSCDFDCAIFVELTFWSSHIQSCRTHPTIGTTPWFSYLYTKHKSLSFVKKADFQSYQIVPMSCICRWHQRCQHPTNHRHYPMFSKFGCLKKYSFKHNSPSFWPNTLSNHSKLYQCLAFVSFTIDATTQRIIGTTLWFVSLKDWIIICIFQKPLGFVQKYQVCN